MEAITSERVTKFNKLTEDKMEEKIQMCVENKFLKNLLLKMLKFDKNFRPSIKELNKIMENELKSKNNKIFYFYFLKKKKEIFLLKKTILK